MHSADHRHRIPINAFSLGKFKYFVTDKLCKNLHCTQVQNIMKTLKDMKEDIDPLKTNNFPFDGN